MMTKSCAHCGKEFQVKRACYDRRKHCSKACHHAEMKGRKVSPETQFKPGHAFNLAPIGEVRTHPDKGGRPRAWVKVGQPNHWRPRAQVEWEGVNGPIPHGMIVHHDNRDTLDDSIGNLVLTSRAAHLDEHRGEFVRTYRSGANHHSALRPEVVARGERHGMALLTEQQVREIRAATGETARALAEKHGVTRAAIKAVRIRRTWRHVA